MCLAANFWDGFSTPCAGYASDGGRQGFEELIVHALELLAATAGEVHPELCLVLMLYEVHTPYLYFFVVYYTSAVVGYPQVCLFHDDFYVE